MISNYSKHASKAACVSIESVEHLTLGPHSSSDKCMPRLRLQCRLFSWNYLHCIPSLRSESVIATEDDPISLIKLTNLSGNDLSVPSDKQFNPK